jgi:type I restriction enzyme S subunit
MLKKFSDVLEIRNGKNQRQVENKYGQYPIYGSGGIMGYADKYLCEANAIVIGRKGSINNPLFVEEPFWNVDTAFGLIPKKEILLPKYLYYFCKNYNFEKLNTTVTIPSLTKANLLKIDIFLPPINEQKKIIEILDCINTLVKIRKKQINALNMLVKSQFIEMFGDPVMNEKGWEVKKLIQICDVRDGTHDSPKYISKGHPLITSKNVASGKLDFSEANLISTKDFVQINKRSKVDHGDILMPMIGTIGNPVIVDTYKKFAIKNVALIKFGKSEVLNTYIHILLKSNYLEIETQDSSRGGTQKFIALADIRNLPIPLPPLSLQNEFAAFVEQADKSKFVMQKGLEKLELGYKALMQRYFGQEP